MKNIFKIKINYLTIIFILILILSGYIKNTLMIIFILMFHELGHIFIITLLHYKIEYIMFYPFGGIIKLDKLLNTPIIHDILISIFGILFQIILFLFIKEPLLIKYNISLIIFNLLPIIPLDGSKVLFEILNIFLSYKNSLYVSYIISFTFIILFILYNYYYSINNYIIIGLFIYELILSIKNHILVFNKFILERKLYDLKYYKIINKNEKIKNYYKGVKYYYFINNKVVEEKDYLTNYLY